MLSVPIHADLGTAYLCAGPSLKLHEHKWDQEVSAGLEKGHGVSQLFVGAEI